MTLSKLLASSALFVALASRPVHAQTPTPDAAPKAPPPIMADEHGDLLSKEEPKIKERVARIDAELAALDRKSLKDTDWAKEWAGRYYEGDGLGENVLIHLAPKSGIAFLNYGCMGLYGGDHGEVAEVLPDGLRLKLIIGKAGGSFLSERMYFVKWGERRYLVPDWGLKQFVNNYNQGGLNRSMMFQIPRLEREGQQNPRLDGTAPAGRPELPAEFAKLLRDEPIKLKVSKITPVVRRDVTTGVVGHECTIEFESGTDQGAYLGMQFWYPPNLLVTSGIIEITRVDAKTSTGHLQAFGGKTTEFRPPTVGELLSTAREEFVPPAMGKPAENKEKLKNDKADPPAGH